MRKLAIFGAATWLVVSVGAPATSAQPLHGRTLTVIQASQVGPSSSGPGLGSLGALEPNPSGFLRAKALANARAYAHGGGGHGGGGGGGGPVLTSYSNVSPSFNGVYQSGITPPDTTGAIGPDRYIETVNDEYGIYNRSGSLLNSGSLGSLVGISGLLYSVSDPQMMWDPKTQRFYFSAVYYDAFMSDTGLAVGWSTTATPSSSADFCKYAIGMSGVLPDYPKLGDSPDFVIYGYNKFTNAGSTFAGAEFAALNKPPAGSTCAAGSSLAVTTTGSLPNVTDPSNAASVPVATPVPAKLVDDASGSGYVVATPDLSQVSSGDFISVYSVGTGPGTYSNGAPIPSFNELNPIPVPSFSMPASAAQSGSSYRLDTLDGRLENAVAAVDPTHSNSVAVWTAHSVYGGAGAQERWYELDPNATAVLQSGAVSDTSLFVWNGDVSPDRANNNGTAAFGGDMAMSVSTSSNSTYPAIRFVTKEGASAQSALKPLVQAAGPAVDFSCSSTTPCRWGDYSGASPDPVPGTGTIGKVWLANQYDVAGGTTSSTSWRTWLFAVTP